MQKQTGLMGPGRGAFERNLQGKNRKGNSGLFQPLTSKCLNRTPPGAREARTGRGAPVTETHSALLSYDKLGIQETDCSGPVTVSLDGEHTGLTSLYSHSIPIPYHQRRIFKSRKLSIHRMFTKPSQHLKGYCMRYGSRVLFKVRGHALKVRALLQANTPPVQSGAKGSSLNVLTCTANAAHRDNQ